MTAGITELQVAGAARLNDHLSSNKPAMSWVAPVPMSDRLKGRPHRETEWSMDAASRSTKWPSFVFYKCFQVLHTQNVMTWHFKYNTWQNTAMLSTITGNEFSTDLNMWTCHCQARSDCWTADLGHCCLTNVAAWTEEVTQDDQWFHSYWKILHLQQLQTDRHS